MVTTINLGAVPTSPAMGDVYVSNNWVMVWNGLRWVPVGRTSRPLPPRHQNCSCLVLNETCWFEAWLLDAYRRERTALGSYGWSMLEHPQAKRWELMAVNVKVYKWLLEEELAAHARDACLAMALE